MGGNSFGTIFTVTTFGESHGPATGCVVDGCPAGLPLGPEDIGRELRRRRPGGGPAGTSRNEADEPEILSGVFEGQTLGSPIAILVRNTGQLSADYDDLRDLYRPGHADWTWEAKYGRRDHRGGGRSSGRETLGRVAGGAVAKVFLARQGISIRAWTSAIAGIDIPGPETPGFDAAGIDENPFRLPRQDYTERVTEKINILKDQGDSAGGIVTCTVRGLPPGLGEPVFDKIHARIAGAVLSLGAARGIDFGAGFNAPGMRGSESNDRPLPAESPAGYGHWGLPPGVPALSFATNHAGGVLGGMSTGMPLEFRAAFKPVPSISKPQQTVDRRGAVRELSIRGRHDICIVPRAVPVVEAMTALVIADLLLIRENGRL